MTIIAKTQINHDAGLHQVILLDDKGIICKSCDSIFDTKALIGKHVGEHFLFLASEFPAILSSEADKLTFTQMQSSLSSLPGFYDYTFSKKELKGKTYVEWQIIDYTKVYEEYVKVQQIKNELEIHSQFLKGNSAKKELNSTLNSQFFQSDYKSKQKALSQYFISEEIQNKFDVFDIMSWSKEGSKIPVDLEELRDQLEILIQEINFFLNNVRNDVEVVDVRALIKNLLAAKRGIGGKSENLILFEDGLPVNVEANKKVLGQIVNLLCKNELTKEVYSNASLTTSFIEGSKDEPCQLTLNYIEHILDKSKFLENPTERIIKISILRSLVLMSGGKLQSKYSDDNSIFGVFLTVPVK